MDKNASTTAEGMAIVRAIEASRPENVRICYDPVARALVPAFKYHASKWFIDAGLYGRMAPGAIEFITARERYIDDFLFACLSEGLDQLVLLGAGFDTRPYRIAGLEKIRVFEVDHPATQAEKRRRLAKLPGLAAGHVTFVAVDFNTQSLGERLAAAGYGEQAKTLFIWQGVTAYLTPAGVDATLAFVAGHSGPGSAVIFDYFYTQTLRDMNSKSASRILKAVGERLTFGIDEGTIEPFLAARGFRDIRSVDGHDLKQLYFTGPNAARPVSPGVAIASARVGEAADIGPRLE
jgi:methyltransferase (TIGR00027 family)